MPINLNFFLDLGWSFEQIMRAKGVAGFAGIMCLVAWAIVRTQGAEKQR